MMELLGRGAHASPRDGCNVLEYASVLAGERWTSCPPSVHPALTDVAFLVNDQMTDDGRRLLTPLAPWLLGTNTTDPQTWPAITEVYVRAALTWAGQPDEPRLQADLNAARNWPAEASRPANRRRTPRAERRQRRWAWHAAQAQPTHGKTEPATTHRFWSVNGMRNSEARRGSGCPVLIPSPDRG